MNRNAKIQKWHQIKRAKTMQSSDSSIEWRVYQNRWRDSRSKPSYSFEEFKIHIESKFIFGSFGWYNYGEWEVDHIMPLSKGGKDEIVNIQILTKHDNRTKGAKH